MEKQKKRKFNIVDLAVLVVLVAAVAFLAYKLLKPADEEPASRMGTARFVVEVNGMRESFYNEVAEELPCQMIASGKLVNAYVREARSEPCKVAYVEAANPVNGAEASYVIPDESIPYVNAFFTIEAPVDLNTDTNTSLSQELRLGHIYYIKGRTIELVGTIVELELGE